MNENNCLILLAEDNKINQVLMKKSLEKYGYDTRCVVDGEEALEVLKDTKISLVLMDVEMPRMDGLEATRELRTNPKYALNADVPVVAMSAHDGKKDQDKTIRSGMSHFFPKPVEIPALIELIKKICD